ncbi:MAG: hypothetical protein JXB05_02395 [Myxococcaceae bacterium]|nr:hypothetical protein [Myxococcaceae bacterium]
MRNTLLMLSAALALLVVGCKTTGPLPQIPTGGSAPSPAPALPAWQQIPDSGVVPTLPRSTHIVVALCRATGKYTAMGVDTKTARFTFLMQGGQPTQGQAFTQFYAAGVPVTVYTERMKLRAPMPPALAPEGEQTEEPPPTDPSTEPPPEPTCDPCNISEPPPEPGRKPTGITEASSDLEVFRQLAWRTAGALDGVSVRAPATTAPLPQ